MPETPRVATLTVGEADAGRRLDQVIAAHVDDLSRSQVQRLIRSGRVINAAGTVLKTATSAVAGTVITIALPAVAAASPQPEPLGLPILFDDGDIAVVDKPAGMVVHPAAGHASGTMVNALLHHLRGLSGIGGQERPGIVHRLDKGTSGVMVIAKHDRAHRDLARQFHDRIVDKEYVALVWGRPKPGQTFDTAIGRDPRHRQRMSSRARQGRPARTVVISVEPMGAISLIRVGIETGRTHQIRVHLSEAGFPVVGDALYGGSRARTSTTPPVSVRRPLLHAARLTFDHPGDRRRLSFEAPLPDDFTAALAAIRAAPGGGTPRGRP